MDREKTGRSIAIPLIMDLAAADLVHQLEPQSSPHTMCELN